ncbi:unnamed protein product [Rotaria sordida]|uniref:Uncharacterized protein n=1 Tax=Rotaria sordida TaxID=392033 RepID=A0A818NMD1_9BILA|nr:unnamed protein product [Rotaria sordida]CAF3609218.1 unnamed protein product [Rotaria sordida]
MKSQIFILLLLIINVFFFQPTHQHRLSKRELTEYDQYPEIKRFCKYHPGFDYCRRIQSYSLLLFWSSPKSSSLLSSSPKDSITPDVNPWFVPSSASKSSDIESFIDPQRINKEK